MFEWRYSTFYGEVLSRRVVAQLLCVGAVVSSYEGWWLRGDLRSLWLSTRMNSRLPYGVSFNVGGYIAAVDENLFSFLAGFAIGWCY